MEITIKKYNGINVLRDDLLPGGTKAVLMPYILKGNDHFVYASPVYGGFQIALSIYCKENNLKSTIFCARRKNWHSNTVLAKIYGANIKECYPGYLSVVEKKAREYCEETGATKLKFGANSEKSINILSNRMEQVSKKMGDEPDEIWVAIGSGTLVDSILKGTKTAKIYGVQVGAEYEKSHERLTVLKYHKSFDKKSTLIKDFPSIENYDLKAWEYCLNHYKIYPINNKNVLFWNVL